MGLFKTKRRPAVDVDAAIRDRAEMLEARAMDAVDRFVAEWDRAETPELRRLLLGRVWFDGRGDGINTVRLALGLSAHPLGVETRDEDD